MESSGEVSVLDYVRLMAKYLSGDLGAEQYTKTFFAFNKKRVNLPDLRASELVQRAHGDADDYEPDVELRKTNPQWLGEKELRQRVAKSLCDLEAIGYGVDGG